MKKSILKVVVLFMFVLVATTGCFNKEKVESFVDEVDESISQQIKKEISIGEWTENDYSNDFLGLIFTKPESWTRYSDDQIKELMQIGSEMVDVSELNKKIAELTSVTYMMASDVTGSNIIVMSEKPVVSISVDNYAKQLKTQLEAQTQITYNPGEIKTETINGKEFTTLVAQASTLKQKYYLYNVDKYIVAIIVTSTTGESPDTLLQHFTFE